MVSHTHIARRVICCDGSTSVAFLRRDEASKLLDSGLVRATEIHPHRGVVAVEYTELSKEPKSIPTPARSSSARFISVAASVVSRVQSEYRTAREAAIGSHCESEWLAIVARYGNKCLRCGISDEHEPLTKDHIVPVSEGGTDFASNLQPLCLSCNAWKGNRDIDFRGPLAFAAVA